MIFKGNIELKQNDFKNEKELQKYFENNLEKILGFKFICIEFGETSLSYAILSTPILFPSITPSNFWLIIVTVWYTDDFTLFIFLLYVNA